MKRYFGIITTVALVLVVLIALNAAGTITLDRPPEDEYFPIRSTYNAGPTGTRALYQLLEESGYKVARWRANYKDLILSGSEAQGASLVVIGPFLRDTELEEDELRALQKWLAAGGQLLIVSRNPRAQFDDGDIQAQTPAPPEKNTASPPERENEVEKSDLLIAQPTALTRNIRGFVISQWASRLLFYHPTVTEHIAQTDQTDEDATSSAPPQAPPQFEPYGVLTAPVIHLGDSKGAVLAECTYGKGRVLFLTDPFVLANNGIARGANLNLALNLIEALGGTRQKIFFDEYHHGYRSQGNALMNYFRGTPVPWLFAQLLLVAVLVAYSYGRRFARPLPMPLADRHSPLEFVSSMASLQQAAQARDLALENIYPRFKQRLCRTLGLPTTAPPPTIIARLKRRLQTKESEVELLRVFSESERALQGEPLDDQRLIKLIATMRRIAGQLKLT